MINKKWLEEKETCKEGTDWFQAKYGDQGERQGLEVVKDLMADDQSDWANWLIVRIMERSQYLTYAIYSAEQVIDIFEKQYPDDNRPRLAIEAAKKVLEDDNTENRAAASAATSAAARDAWAAGAAARSAAGAARSAAGAAWGVGAADAASAASDAAAAAMRTKILNYGIGLLEEQRMKDKIK